MLRTKKATVADISGVLALQAKNLASNLSEQEREKGFVTTPFTIPQIEAIIAENGLFVAETEGEIVAYIFAASWAYFSQWPIFEYMVSRFPQVRFRGNAITTENSFQYGPICIDEAHRGSGLLFAIFEEFRKELATRYPFSLTFINAVNKPSLKAHIEKLGWTIVDEFEFNGNRYYALGYDMTVKVKK